MPSQIAGTAGDDWEQASGMLRFHSCAISAFGKSWLACFQEAIHLPQVGRALSTHFQVSTEAARTSESSELNQLLTKQATVEHRKSTRNRSR
jgi:hypothetical protein